MTFHPPFEADGPGWSRVRALLEGALERDAQERRAWLAGELEGDEAALEQVLELLALDEESSTGDSGPSRLPDPIELGERVGPYVIRRVLGRGGMGTVFLARRADGAFQSQVAVKLVRPHAGSDEILARFRRERQVQAGLDHPGIVRLLDGGTTDAGIPYLVMEYVEGLAIDRYCDEFRLSTRERLALFRQVVDAVAHAHEARVIHRDLKPSNILVTKDGRPKLLDFGIAKVLDADKLAADIEVTAFGFGTPAYASPEQLRGLPVTPASDQYSLGVLLYQLLSGEPPHDLTGLSPAEAEKRVCSGPPPKPSDAVKRTLSFDAESRPESTRGLRRLLAGDLDRVALQCLRKEPQRRYPSVRALGEDIDAYLAGRPIKARRDSALYRAGKFASRNRLPVLLTSLIVAILTGSLLWSLSQNRRLLAANTQATDQKEIADERLARLRSLRLQLVREMRRSLATLPGAVDETERVVKVVLSHIDQEAALAGNDPAALCEVAEVLLGLGELYFSRTGSSLGKSEAAEDCFTRAVAMLERAQTERPDHPRPKALLCEAHTLIGDVCMYSSDLERTERHYSEAIAVAESLPEEAFNRSLSLSAMRTAALDGLTTVASQLGQFERARASNDELMRQWKALDATFPEAFLISNGGLMHAQIQRTEIELKLDQPGAALAWLDRTRPQLVSIRSSHAGSNLFEQTWIRFKLLEGAARQALGSEEWESAFVNAVEVAREQRELSEGELRSLLDSTRALTSFAKAQLDAGELPLAKANALEAAEDARAMKQQWPDLVSGGIRLARAEIILARIALQTDDLLRANELAGGARRELEQRVLASPRRLDWVTDLAESLLLSAEIRLAYASERGEPRPPDGADREGARALLNRASELIAPLVSDGRGAGESVRLLAQIERALDRARESGEE